MTEQLQRQERREIRRAFAHASQQGWGIAMGLVAGLALWLATVILVVRGGDSPGAHLGLLAVYFPGYRISVPGACVGFIYAFVVGYAIGRTVATFYNGLLPRKWR